MCIRDSRKAPEGHLVETVSVGSDGIRVNGKKLDFGKGFPFDD